MANKNLIKFENDSSLAYDVLILNVGSRTLGTKSIPGIWEHSLTTRPINNLLPKIEKIEESLMKRGIIPNVVICGAGAAGTELAFAFKR